MQLMCGFLLSVSVAVKPNGIAVEKLKFFHMFMWWLVHSCVRSGGAAIYAELANGMNLFLEAIKIYFYDDWNPKLIESLLHFSTKKNYLFLISDILK